MNDTGTPREWAQCAARAGVLDRYEAFDGTERRSPEAALRRALVAMGVTPSQPPDAAGFPACVVLREGEPLRLRWRTADTAAAHWELAIELDTAEGGVGPLASGTVACDGMHASVAHALSLPPGYYTLRVHQGSTVHSCRLAVAPQGCWVPAALQAGARWWGYTAQLYALRSPHNCGIGDFGDLRRLVTMAAAQGAAFIGLNPLHALFPEWPEQASPYSPSSRLALNPLYLDLQAVIDAFDGGTARKLWHDPDYQQRLQQLRETELVDYAGVAAAKQELLALAWHDFETQELQRRSPRGRAFRAYLVERAASLGMHALYDALQAHLVKADPAVRGWQDWPAPYRDPHGAAVQAFRETQATAVRFRLWLQWLAEQQLAQVHAEAQRAGMPLGLYRDLAVGVDPGGSETWLRPDLYALDMRIGAPPDQLQPQGQDWGLAPPTPLGLRGAAYQPFIDTLRANMRSAGALRLDHVMVLMRLFWTGPDGGVYVRYPVEDLLGLLALESHRHRCMVVGEDLGTVPPQMHEAMAQGRLLSYRPLMFAYDEATGFPPPEGFTAQAFASFGTHDLPTLAGFWQGVDLQLRRRLAPDAAADAPDVEMQQRRQLCERLLQALQQAGVAQPSALPPPGADANAELVRAVYAYLARTPCWLVGVQLEDVTLQPVQVNLPGTREDQFPNWRRKIGCTLDALAADPRLHAVVRALGERQSRSRGSPSR